MPFVIETRGLPNRQLGGRPLRWEVDPGLIAGTSWAVTIGHKPPDSYPLVPAQWEWLDRQPWAEEASACRFHLLHGWEPLAGSLAMCRLSEEPLHAYAGLLGGNGSREARRRLKQFAAAHPDVAEVQWALAQQQIAAGHVAKAEDTLTHILERWPTIPNGWSKLIDLRRRRGNLSGAIAAGWSRVELDPTALMALWSALNDWAATVSAEQALAAWNRLVAWCERQRMPCRAEILTSRAACHSSLGDVDAALQDVNRALDQQPTSSWSRRVRAHIRFSQLDDPAGALADLDAALVSQDWVGALHVDRARVLHALGQLDAARAALEMARELGQDVTELEAFWTDASSG